MDDDDDEIIVPINNDLEKKIADVFEVFDHAGTKTVDAREIGTIVRALGCCPTEAEVQELIFRMEDPANPGTIHLINLLPIVSHVLMEHKYVPATPDELLHAFQVLDDAGYGYLTKEQITNFMTQDGEPFTQDELDEMLEIAIDPHTETVPYEYYINQLMHEPQTENTNIYILAARIKAETQPVVPVQKRFSQFLADVQLS